MWEHLKSEQKEKYKTLITNFASLSQAFSQKAESEDEGQTEHSVAPIVNSKFQETVSRRLLMPLEKILPIPHMMLLSLWMKIINT